MRRIIHLRWIGTAILAALVLSTSSTVLAQSGANDRVEVALQRTDEALAKARLVVQESDSRRAREVLETAFRIQGEAWNRFRNSRLVEAASLTAEARQLAARAVNLAREDGALRSRAGREIEQARRGLEAAREHIGADVAGAAQRLLEQAAELIERAQVKFGEQQYEAAFRLATSAQQLIRQAVGMSGGSESASRVLRELERTDHLIERVADLVSESDNPDAQAMLDRGRAVQTRAWDAYRDGRWPAAAAGTREARNLANRARALAQGPVNSDNVARALAETDRLLDRAADVVAESGSDAAVSILERARGHQAKAHDLLSEGELRKALAETRVARSLIKRALRAADPAGVR
ncbi:MAG: hypothetical protein DHS20C21_04230 [Gemmatimonadota bacterium]|nr:MAG: hypothetical protein DHS20C21_04230 [Gemmatimonadota bacterium]